MQRYHATRPDSTLTVPYMQCYLLQQIPKKSKLLYWPTGHQLLQKQPIQHPSSYLPPKQQIRAKPTNRFSIKQLKDSSQHSIRPIH